MGAKEVICNRCGYPVRKGVLPIIFPGNGGKCKPYCSVVCFEATAGFELPEPMRSNHLRVENGR